MRRLINKRIAICLLSLILGFVVAACSIVAYAYFSKKEIYDGYMSGNIELLFDRLGDTGLEAYGTAEGIEADKTAEWGTKANPYVISDSKHLYNLSELQNLGYFARKHLSKNTETDLSNIPYFLVCTPDYTPVLIDGSSLRAIWSIGNDKYPFIGSIKGVSGEQKVTVGENSCDTSVIHGVSVRGNPSNADAGLFGYVSFLGTPPAAGSAETTFMGTPSVISNMVLSDVTVSVDSSLWDKIEAFITDIAIDATGGHRYSFSELYNASDMTAYDSVPHENHHIGILAGHVSYSQVDFISIFYSKGNIVAIDLSDENTVGSTEANYFSAAGILGFIYNMNPKIDAETGNIIANSGESIGDLSYSMVGGGGLEVGDMPGYILASDMYEKYGYIAADTPIADGATLKIAEATDKEGNPLCKEWNGGITLGGSGTSYYFYDGVFTFALSSNDDVIETTWKDNVTPDLYIGLNSADSWKTDVIMGQKAVTAYIRQIKNDSDLQTAITEGKSLIIMKENLSAGNGVLMSLYKESSVDSGASDFSLKYFTQGATHVYAQTDKIASLYDSYVEYPSQFVDGFEEGTTDEEIQTLVNVIDTLRNDTSATIDGITWKIIDLDATAGDLTTEEQEIMVQALRDEYRILSGHVGNSYFSGETVLTVNSSGVSDYYDYSKNTQDLQGYFYYTSQRNILLTRYTYFWQPLNGNDVVPLAENTTTAPNNYFTSQSTNWNGETLYERDGRIGVVVNRNTAKFHGKDVIAYTSGANLHKLTGNNLTYFYRPVGDTNYYYMSDAAELENGIDPSAFSSTGNKSEAGLDFYQDSKGRTGVLVDRYNTYEFYSQSKNLSSDADDNYLRIIKSVYNWLGTKYTLWNGPTSAATTDTFAMTWPNNSPTVTFNTEATVKFNTDGTCYIQYSIDSVNQFVNYTGDQKFNTSFDATDNTRLCIYVLENTQALNFGRATFVPKDSTEQFALNGGNHVLWPESGAVQVATPGTESSLTAGVNTQYSVYSLATLEWKNGNALDNGGVLHEGNLYKKFRMLDGIAFGANIDIGINIGTGGLIRAPVGPEGTYTDIPAGCIAFKVNKTSEEAQKIRVIIAVPKSDYFPGEDGYDLGDYTRYFCMWSMPENTGEGSSIFRAQDYIERFEIPRSHYYDASSATPDGSEHVTVTYNGNQNYRVYLNAERLLVAYEFKVYNEGVYVLGTSTSTSDSGNIFGEKDSSPMEIVYFSADGVASSGRDGESGSQLGTIDYVYSYDKNIVPVEERSSTNDEGNEDYSTYYPSYCMLYMNSLMGDGSLVNINSEKVYIRRYVIGEDDTPTSSGDFLTTPSRSTIAFKLEADKHSRLIQYSRLADNVIQEE